MKIISLEWDDANVEHISKHRISPTEVGDVCFGTHIAVKGRNGRYILYGQSDNGRYIKLILVRLFGAFYRPITAYDMPEKEKRTYRSRVG